MILDPTKLIPLFSYPLGLSCISLIVALITLWKSRRVAAIAIILSLSLLLLCGNTWVAKNFVRSLEWQNLPLSPIPNAQAIVVLGGATRSALPPRPTVDLTEVGGRVIYAAELYLQHKAPIIILSGGRSDPGLPESTDMATILISLGIPSTALVQDPYSLNTYENAVNVHKILLARGINRVLLVTSAMHMPRALHTFRHLGIDTIPTPTDFLVSKSEIRELAKQKKDAILDLVPDAKNLSDFTRALHEYIGGLEYFLRGWL
jgi:uncharacterized SAM-binding protein YcdF (DUF218 family)